MILGYFLPVVFEVAVFGGNMIRMCEIFFKAKRIFLA
jgi:hypothetical protein